MALNECGIHLHAGHIRTMKITVLYLVLNRCNISEFLLLKKELVMVNLELSCDSHAKRDNIFHASSSWQKKTGIYTAFSIYIYIYIYI